MSDVGTAALAGWLERFARESAAPEAVERLVSAVDAAILAQVPALRRDPLLVEEMHASTRAHWRAFLITVGTRHRLALPEQAKDFARSLARRGLEVSDLLRAYRAASPPVFQFFVDATASRSADEPGRDELLIHLWTRADRWLDESVAALTEVFEEERRLRGPAAHRRAADLVAELLSGSDPDPTSLSRLLPHQFHLWQTAVVIWTVETSRPAEAVFPPALRHLASALDAGEPLCVPADSDSAWAWLATATKPDLGDLDRVRKRLAELGVRVAVGLAAPGIAGFRSSHAEARAAHRVAASLGVEGPVTRYRDVELLCLVRTGDPLVERMVERELGPLLADRSGAVLRRTALTYLESGRSAEEAAARLFVHPNTIRYRVARAEGLLGHRLEERTALTELALRLAASSDGAPND